MSWLRRFTLKNLDERVAVIEALPGAGDLRKFVDERRRTQLAELLKTVVGRPVQVTLAPHPEPPEVPQEISQTITPDDSPDLAPNRPPSVSPNPRPEAVANTHPNRPSQPAPSPLQGPPPRPPQGAAPTDRQAAMRLPLVKKIMELFDASIMDVRPASSSRPSGSSPNPTPPPPPPYNTLNIPSADEDTTAYDEPEDEHV